MREKDRETVVLERSDPRTYTTLEGLDQCRESKGFGEIGRTRV